MNSVEDTGFTESEREVVIPVSVVLQRAIDTTKKWVLPHWTAFAVVAGENLRKNHQRVLIHEDDLNTRFLWGGLVVHLYKDGSEGYWYNLLSDEPYLFVVCEGEQGEQEVEPAFVTANQDEASGYMESDRLVLSVPMPVDIRNILERYVVSHYVPETKRKRKRRDWVEDSDFGKRPRH